LVDKKKLLTLIAPYQKIFLAYSGGLDSSVLLHLLVNLREFNGDLNIVAIHVNHNVNLRSDCWVKCCESVCKQLEVPCIIEALPSNLDYAGKSVEEVLRQRRYEIFSQLLSKDGVLLTAHHADDQAETIFLQLLRGAGARGLAAMAEKASFAQGYLLRPLLSYRRKDLLAYAVAHNLKWVEDNSNFDESFDRNYLRHSILPLIEKRWPGFVKTAGRSGHNLAEASDLMDNLAEQDLVEVAVARDIIDAVKLRSLTVARQKNLLRFWLRTIMLPVPSEVKIREILTNVLHSRYDANPLVAWSGAEIRRFRHLIYGMPPLEPHDNSLVIPFIGNRAQLPGSMGTLVIIRLPSVITRLDRVISPCRHCDERAGASEEAIQAIASDGGKNGSPRPTKNVWPCDDGGWCNDDGMKHLPCNFSVRFRRGGEKVELVKRGGNHSLAKLMQEWAIPPWQRDRVPLVYDGDNKIIAVIGYYDYGTTCIFTKSPSR
jgi:tRNA(Ile)-lysidine synthase